MTVAVTGAAGRLGRAAIAELQASGLSVRGIDRHGDGVVAADLRDGGATLSALEGCAAIVQLAAWPDPHGAAPASILADNIAIISNVLFAATELGIRKVVAASSQSVLGLPWAEKVIAPDYLPVDEFHPCRPGDAYSVSKLISEEIAAMFARRGDLDIAMLRFPAIWDHERFAQSTARRIEVPEQGAKSQWAYIDQRDAARAIRLALQADIRGFNVFNITSPRAFAPEPLPALVDRWYPGLDDIRNDISTGESCFDFRRAEQHLGFRARYLWGPGGVEDTLDSDPGTVR